MTILFDDTIRQEIRYDVAGTIHVWPWLEGYGHVAASPTLGHCSVTIYDSDGDIVAGPTAIVPTAIPDVGSRFDIAVPASAIGEDYYAVVTWRTASSPTEHQSTVFFDVVREPWGSSSVTLQSIQSLCPDLIDRISNQARRLSITPNQRAMQLGRQARVEVGEWIRGQVVTDARENRVDVAADALGSTPLVSYLRPRMVKDRERLSRVESLLAVSLAYRADMRAGDGDLDDGADQVAAMARDWYERAKASFASSPFRYDIDDDRDIDTAVAPSNVVFARRVQG